MYISVLSQLKVQIAGNKNVTETTLDLPIEIDAPRKMNSMMATAMRESGLNMEG